MIKLQNIIEIHEEKCDGRGLCVPSCAEGAIRMVSLMPPSSKGRS